jgi:hypothetical protein
MNFLSILNEAFQILVPLAIILGISALALFLDAKKKEVKAKTDSEVAHKYLDMLEDTIMKSVISTTQTYVEALKGKNAFDADAQKIAFQMSYDAVMATLTDEAKKYLTTIVSDLETYITTRIEYNVNVCK